MEERFHVPVLLQEVVKRLQVKDGEKYIDATIGGGGHSFAILKHGGKVLGLDVDQDALDYVEQRVKNNDLRFKNNLTLIRGNFRDIEEIAAANGFEEVSGILFDLGVSSFQLEEPLRGFSFQKEGPLDMRMDKDLPVKAADLVNGLTKGELYELFTKLGEEHHAYAISERIVRARRIKLIVTTKELSGIISGAYPKSYQGIHPATRVFQAIRIAINDELDSLEEALPKSLNLLKKNGRIAVISFHSLEDRIVKQMFQEFFDKKRAKILTDKPLVATDSEVQNNPRARSAKLRIIEKL